MLGHSIWLAMLAGPAAYAQSTTILTGSVTAVVTGDDILPSGPGVSYVSYSSIITMSSALVATANDTKSTLAPSERFPSPTLTYLKGTGHAGNQTSISLSAQPTNTQPCNNYPEFCMRKYSNITMVAAHNFAFARPGNAASNQVYGVLDQLNDGIRMLQGQTQFVNDTMYYCHTSCDIFNAGTLESYFTQIRQWVEVHPYDVVTILIGNGDFCKVQTYVDPIVNSGLERFAYQPPKVPMSLDDWPTLGQMILKQQRVVMFIDYNANQTEVPYVLDEFSQLWETPFSPTNASFPCTEQRPPGISKQQAQQRLYMANHNLNTPVNLFGGDDILLPNTVFINQTNAVSGNISLGLMANHCVSDWGRPPNFLLVDFYNYGNFPGSVFEVAAQQNNVTYTRCCCGTAESAAASSALSSRVVGLVICAAVALVV